MRHQTALQTPQGIQQACLCSKEQHPAWVTPTHGESALPILLGSQQRRIQVEVFDTANTVENNNATNTEAVMAPQVCAKYTSLLRILPLHQPHGSP